METNFTNQNSGQPLQKWEFLPHQTNDQRLEMVIAYCLQRGYSLSSKNESLCQATMIRPAEKVNHVLHLLLGVFTCSLWWLAWLCISLTADKESIITFKITDDGLVDFGHNQKSNTVKPQTKTTSFDQFAFILAFATIGVLVLIASFIEFNGNRASNNVSEQIDTLSLADISKQDSLRNIELEKEAKIEKQRRKKWLKTKAGKVYKFGKQKGFEWSEEDCELVADNRIWVGMNFWMLVYQNGLPDRDNISDYGNGTRHQYVWRDHSPSYYYDDNDDGIIDSYN